MGSTATPDDASPQIAIIGGGIVGLVLAADLHRRSIHVTVSEQAHSLRESGAGIGFNIAAKACMDMIDPAFEESLNRTLKIWNFDAIRMTRQSVERYGKAVEQMRYASTQP